MKNINTLKRKCHVGINVVFLELILELYDVCFMKNIFIAPWTCLHRFYLHIIIRWPENVRRVNIVVILYIVIFCWIQWKQNTVVLTDKSAKMTAGSIKPLGFQDRLSSIALSFDFVKFGYYNWFVSFRHRIS
jgi:flagellar biosynthesis protein FlhB